MLCHACVEFFAHNAGKKKIENNYNTFCGQYLLGHFRGHRHIHKFPA